MFEQGISTSKETFALKKKFEFYGRELRSVRIAVCKSCGVWESQCVVAAVCGCCWVRELLGPGVTVYGSCSALELQCMGVAVFGSRTE